VRLAPVDNAGIFDAPLLWQRARRGDNCDLARPRGAAIRMAAIAAVACKADYGEASMLRSANRCGYTLTSRSASRWASACT
jgi:hypothetical protein